MSRDPYCRNCGYSLRGLTESSKCPECGKPIVEVLERDRSLPRGKRYRSPIVLFGLPLVHIALGPDGDEHYGRARGIIAIGDTASGWLAIGGRAFGIIAIGGLAIGLFSFGGGSIGLIAFGGGAIGGMVYGGGAAGVVAKGGGAAGYIADGGGAMGYYARGGQAKSPHPIDWRRKDPEAVAVFDRWSWLFGPQLGPGATKAMILGQFRYPACILGAGLSIAALCAAVLLLAYLGQADRR